MRVHRGVYRVGHRARSREADYLAAVKACGEHAVLCGRAAAHLWHLIRGSPPKPEVLTYTNRRVGGVVVHRARHTEIDRVIRLGIPVTTVPRTLVDLASSLPEPALARACHEAGVLYRTTPRQVDSVLVELPSAPGRAKLRRVLHGDVPVTLSHLETQFLKLLGEAGLPLPTTNRVASAHRVDCRWPETGSRLSSTATGFTTPAIRGNRTGSESGRRERVVMCSATTRGETSSKTPSSCSESCGRCWPKGVPASTSYRPNSRETWPTRRSRSPGRVSPRMGPQRRARPAASGSPPRAGPGPARGW
jgi:hypothetical protein